MNDPMLETAHVFVVEAAAEPDALLRVLSAFAVRQVNLCSVRMAQLNAATRIEIQASGLPAAEAQAIRAKLEGFPSVRAVRL